MFGIEPNGDLRWYRYSGHGEANRTGHLGWHANSGNRVGNGWQNFRHINGDIFGVHESGDLRWYGYEGNGERDQAGVLGWRANSGSLVGNGW